MEPPIQTEYLRSGGAVILTYQKTISPQIEYSQLGKAAMQ